MKHVTCKYPDVALAKALRAALKVSEADPYRAQIVRQRACDLVQRRGTTCSFGGGGGGVSAVTVNRLGPEAEQRQDAIDAAHWILQSALSMGTMAADYREGLAAVARFFDAGRPRRPPLDPKVRSLTDKQIEAYHIVGECKGNFAEAGRRLGIDRKTVKERYAAAARKLGVRAMPKPKTVALPVDRRGQVNASPDRRR